MSTLRKHVGLGARPSTPLCHSVPHKACICHNTRMRAGPKREWLFIPACHVGGTMQSCWLELKKPRKVVLGGGEVAPNGQQT